MKKKFSRVISAVLALVVVLSCLVVSVVPASAATYRNGAQSGPSSSYKNGKYYKNYLKVPITGDNRTDLLAIALSQLGYQEGASNGAFSGEVSGSSNYVEYSYNMGDLGLGYGGSDYPWCACFVSWCLYQSRCTNQGTYSSLARYHSGDYDYIWKEISCSQWVRQLKGAGYFKYSKYEGGSYTPKSGDLVFFQNSGGVAHIGLCLYTDGGRIYTVEGNTSSNSGLEANGGGVYFKNYDLGTSYLYGYGTLPYVKNSSVPQIDYSGKNPTPGLYVTYANKYFYTTEDGDAYDYIVPRYTIVEVTGECSNGRLRALYTTPEGTVAEGYLLNTDARVIQLTSTEETMTPEEIAREDLKKTIESAKSIRHYNYTEATILLIRSAYSSAVSVFNNTASTEAQLKEANTTLKNLIAQTGSNTIAYNNKGVYVSGRNAYIGAGDCFVYSPLWNDGLVATNKANICYTVNVVVGWDSYLNCNVVKSVSEGTGTSTPSIQLNDGEWLIAAHNWEYGVSDSDNPVEYSGTNYYTLLGLEEGTKVYLSGGTILNAGTDVEPAAFIKFAPPESTKMTAKNEKAEKGDFVLFTPEFNGGLLTHSNANVHKTLNVVAQWDESKGIWVVTDKFHGNGKEDESSNIEITDGQVVISGYAWEAGVTDGTSVAGSTGNYNMLDTAQIGQQVVFSGISPNTGSDYLSISANIDFVDYEGEVEEEEDELITEPVNLALNKTYEASAATAYGYVADLTDGKYAEKLDYDYKDEWFGFTFYINAVNGAGIVTVDLEDVYNLSSFRVHLSENDKPSGVAQPAKIMVETSLDGENYTLAGYMTTNQDASVSYWAECDTDKTTIGRYVRYTIYNNEEGYNWMMLNEVEAYGTSVTGKENIALGATQTADSVDGYYTSLTDGVADKELASDKWFGFLSTDEDVPQNTENGVGSVVLDLGARFSIREVKAHFFAGENSESIASPAEAVVYVSIDGSTYAKAGSLALNADSTEPYWAELSTDGAVGRYVKIQVTNADKWALLNEVEIYGNVHVQTDDNNIALEKPYSSPAFTNSPFTASLTDGTASNIFQYGVNNSSWFAFKNTGDNATGNTTNNRGIVTIDLGGQAEITGSKIHLFAGANDAGAVQPGVMNIYISDDGKVFDYITYANPDVSKTSPYWAEFTWDEPVYARYIKYAVSVAEGDMVLLNEISVTGTMLTLNESDEPGSMSNVALSGNFNNWNATPNMQRVDENNVSVALELSEGKYEFKLLDGSEWYGNNGEIENTTEHTSENGWEMTADAGNCILNATGGIYTFLYNKETRMLKVLHTPDTYYIRGDFNEWGTWDVLSENEDGTFSKTLTLDAGTYEFKAANEEYTKQWPEFNNSITLSRKTDVTFTLDIFANTLTYTTEINDFFVTFKGYNGAVLSTQQVRRGGAAQAPEVPVVDGYNFTGWDKNFDNVTEDVTVSAVYQKNHGTFKVDVTGGTGFTISVNGGASRPQGSTYINTKMPIGASVTVVAMSNSDAEFMGWINPANGQILTKEYTYSFTTSGNDFIKAMYKTDIDGVNSVIFKNGKAYSGNGQILDMQYYAYGDEITTPANPSQVGFDFKGWDTTEEGIQENLKNNKDTEVLATWKAQLVYVPVEIIGGTGEGTVDAQGNYVANLKMTLTADEAPEGMRFGYWTLDSKVMSYSEVCTFYPYAACKVEAVFIDEDTQPEYQAVVKINTIDTVTEEIKNIFYYSWCVPEAGMEVTYVKAGIVAMNEKFYDGTNLYVGSPESNMFDRSPEGTTANKAENTYTWTKTNVAVGDTWVAKAYVQYRTADGTLHTVYSDLARATK